MFLIMLCSFVWFIQPVTTSYFYRLPRSGTHSPCTHSCLSSQSRLRTQVVPSCQIDISAQARSPADATDNKNPWRSVQCCFGRRIATSSPCFSLRRIGRNPDRLFSDAPRPGGYAAETP